MFQPRPSLKQGKQTPAENFGPSRSHNCCTSDRRAVAVLWLPFFFQGSDEYLLSDVKWLWLFSHLSVRKNKVK